MCSFRVICLWNLAMWKSISQRAATLRGWLLENYSTNFDNSTFFETGNKTSSHFLLYNPVWWPVIGVRGWWRVSSRGQVAAFRVGDCRLIAHIDRFVEADNLVKESAKFDNGFESTEQKFGFVEVQNQFFSDFLKCFFLPFLTGLVHTHFYGLKLSSSSRRSIWAINRPSPTKDEGTQPPRLSRHHSWSPVIDYQTGS